MLTAIAIAATTFSQAPVTPMLYGRLVPGPHEVGIRSEYRRYESERQTSEPLGPEIARIRMTVWYPAAPSRMSRMTFAQYLAMIGVVGSTAPAHEELSQLLVGDKTAVTREQGYRLGGERTLAKKDAPTAEGRFPLLFWSGRHHTEAYQCILSEYLAGHGYVVAAMEYVGGRLPLPVEIQDPLDKVKLWQSLMRDLKATYGIAKRLPNVDPSRVGILNWSYAFESAAALQVGDPAAKLVLSFSSNPMARTGPYHLGAYPSRVLVDGTWATYVNMSEKAGSDGKRRSVPDAGDSKPFERYDAVFEKMAHGSFNVVEGFVPSLVALPVSHPWSKVGPDAQLGFETAARLAVLFADSSLKGVELKSEKLDWIKELPKGTVTLTRTKERKTHTLAGGE